MNDFNDYQKLGSSPDYSNNNLEENKKNSNRNLSLEDQKIKKIESEAITEIPNQAELIKELKNKIKARQLQDAPTVPDLSIITPAHPLKTPKEEDPKEEDPKEEDPRFIVQNWNDGKGHQATEKAERIDTVIYFKEAAIAEKKALEKRSQNAIASEREKIEKRIAQLDVIIKKCKDSSVNWADSNYFRSILQKNLNFSKELSLRDKINEYDVAIKKEYETFLPAINMRYQTCQVNGKNEEGKTKGWLRVGVVTDLSNGYTNLNSLYELKNKLINEDIIGASKIRNEIVKDILLTLKNKNIEDKAYVSAGYALKELGFDFSEIEEILSQVREKSPKISVEIRADAKTTLLETVKKRERILEAQFLQIVLENLKKSNKSDLEGGFLKMLHVSLLNPHSKSIDQTGWNHDEKNEMYDMAAIFEKFDNKNLICDGKGPFVDDEGNIHLPLGLPGVEYGEGKVLTLRSLFVNQCVQGSFSLNPTARSPLLNKGDQKKLNNTAYLKLNNELGIKNPEMNQILQAQKTGFKNAARLIEIADETGFKVSTGCLSAKDRTGFVSALVSDAVMKDFPKSSRTKFMRGQLRKTSLANRIVEENTGAKYMKLTDFRIEGITKGVFNLKSIATRVSVYFDQIKGIMKEKSKN